MWLLEKHLKNKIMNSILSIYWLVVASIWYFVNGILHDIFCIINHKKPYDRDLLRLLMDGHVLILSGAIMSLCYLMIRNNIHYGSIIGIILGIGMIVYCFMIWPFLKSFVTLMISIMVIIVCIKLYPTPLNN
jgi:hypothetical protein